MARKVVPLVWPLLLVVACPGEPEPPLGPVEPYDVRAEVDPDVATILRVRWAQDAAADAWLEFDRGDGEWRTSPATAREAGLHEELILGVPAETDVVFRVVTDNGGTAARGDEQAARTGALPVEMVEPALGTWRPDLAGPEEFVLGSVDVDGGEAYIGPNWLFIANREGQVVWYREIGAWVTLFPRVARDGSHIAWERHNLLDAAGILSTHHRSTLDGRWTQEMALPGLGWAWDETDNGTVLYDRHHGVDQVTLEAIAPDGTQTTVWDCTAWIAQWTDDQDRCYSNTVNWDPVRDSVMWSTYWGDWIAEIDRVTGEVRWHAGSLDDGWTVDAEAGFDLQHYPNFSPEGTLVVSTHLPGVEGEQRAREFEVDEDSETLREIWTYGEGVDLWEK